MKAAMKGGPRNTITSLNVAAKAWPTATATDWKGSGPTVKRKDGKIRDRLDYVAERRWATPNAHDGRRPGADHFSTQGANLSRDAATWGTPRVEMGRALGNPKHITKDRGKGFIEDQVVQWSTPSVADVTGGRKARSGSRSDEMLNNSLAPLVADATWATPTSLSFGESHQPGNSHSYNANMAKANALSSALQAPPTSTHGELSPNVHLACYLRYRATTCSRLRSELRWLLLKAIRRRDQPKPGEIRRHRRGWTREVHTAFVRPSFRRSLNPAFVGWLMAWPPGSTSFDCSATASATHAEHWRSELSRLSSPPTVPAPRNLFDGWV
jgi:hypothetical protein